MCTFIMKYKDTGVKWVWQVYSPSTMGPWPYIRHWKFISLDQSNSWLVRWLLRRFNTTWVQHSLPRCCAPWEVNRLCLQVFFYCKPEGPTTQGLLPTAPSLTFLFGVYKCGIWVVLKPSGVESAKQSPRGSSDPRALMEERIFAN